MKTNPLISTLPVILMTAVQGYAFALPDSRADAGRSGAELALDVPPDAVPDFHLSLSPFLWVTNFSGNMDVKNIQLDVTKSFIDIWDSADSVFGLMGAVDFDYKRFVFQLNGSWVTAEESRQKGVFRNGTVDADVKLDAAWFEVFAGYRFLDRPLGDESESHRRIKLDGFVGGRETLVDIDTTLRSSATVTLPDGEVLNAGQSTERSQSNDWFEPFVGMRTIINLNDHWLIQARGDVGGFGINGSKFAWQAAAVVGYQWQCEGWNFSLFGGYRALGQDHSSGDLNWDVVTHGPMLGASFSFAF